MRAMELGLLMALWPWTPAPIPVPPARAVVAPAPKAAVTSPLSREALKHKATVIREVRFWWGMEEPRDTFAAQIHQESRWREDARSPVGAQGLAQFMPGTATWIANLYPADLKPADALDPKWAIRACVKYDKWLWEKFPKAASRADRWGMSLASYNAGLGWIQKEARQAPDSTRWYDSTENACVRRPSACAESRGYARNIWFRWRPLYAGW